MKKESNYYYEPTIKTARNENNLDDIDKKDLDKITAYICNFDNRYINKQQLISFLEERIKQNEKRLEQFCYKEPGYSYCEGIDDVLEEVLDFVTKGGKDE